MESIIEINELNKIEGLEKALISISSGLSFNGFLKKHALFLLAEEHVKFLRKSNSDATRINIVNSSLFTISNVYLSKISQYLKKKFSLFDENIICHSELSKSPLIPSICIVDRDLNVNTVKLGTALFSVSSDHKLDFNKLIETCSIACCSKPVTDELFLNLGKNSPFISALDKSKIDRLIKSCQYIDGTQLKLVGEPINVTKIEAPIKHQHAVEITPDVLEIDLIEEKLGKTSKITKFIQSDKSSYKHKKRKLATAGFVDGLIFAGIVGFSLGLILMSIIAFIRM